MRMFLKPKNDSHWHEQFRYEPHTGNLFNRYRRGPRAAEGELAGYHNRTDGYVAVRHHRKYYSAHRVIWEMVNGPIPYGMEIDHINGVRGDNRIANLRLVTRHENRRNRCRQSNNTSGYNGVSWSTRDRKYKAYVKLNGVKTHLGYFDTAERAYRAHLAAARKLDFHENHGREQHDEYR